MVVELPDRALLAVAEGRDRLDAAQHRERQRADRVVAALGEAASLGLEVDRYRLGILVDGGDLRPEAHLRCDLRVERVRQLVHAAGDLLHVDVRAADVLAQHLDEGVVHVDSRKFMTAKYSIAPVDQPRKRRNSYSEYWS